MNIKTLHVQNFKNFEDKTFEFGKGFNLIIGDNGTGKTALLEAVSVVLGGYLNDISGSKRQIRISEVRVKHILSGETHTREPQFPAKIEVTGHILAKDLEWVRVVGERGMIRHTSESIKTIASEVINTVQKGKIFTLPIAVYYSTARLWLENKEEITDTNHLLSNEVLSPSSKLEGYTNALDVAVSNKSWRNWFARMELISLQRRESIKVFEAVKKAVESCLEGCDQVYFDIDIGEPIARIHGNPMPFSLLSDGQRNMLAMVADIARRMAQLNPHLLENVTLETPGVVLIDELDLHLHPKWQRTIVDNLRKTFPKVQFIATSHSPFIIQSLRPGELIDLNKLEGAAEFQNQSIEDIVEKVQGVELPQHSERLQKMYEAAKKYYTVLEQAKNADSAELERLKTELDRLSMPFSDDVAYHAFLEMERLAALKELA